MVIWPGSTCPGSPRGRNCLESAVNDYLTSVFQTALADGKLQWLHWGWDFRAQVVWVILIGGLFQNLVSYSADQAVVQRYLTTRDEKAAARSIWTNAAMVIPVSLIWFAVGTALYVFYKAHPNLLDPTLNTDQTFPLFIAQQLPVGIVGVVIGGLFAAFEAGDLQEARRLQGLAVKMVRTIAKWPFHPAMKEVLKMIGSDCGGCRLPHPSLAPHQVAELRKNLRQIGFFRWARPDGAASVAATVDNEH